MLFETKKVPFKPTETKLDKIRRLTKEEFIEDYGSGTLRKNNRLGMKTNSQYWDERIAYEFGYEFEMDYASRITLGVPISEGECKPSTELGWHAERYINTRVFNEDKIEVCYITHEDMDGHKREGNGLVISQTSLDIPDGKIIFVIIQEWDSLNKEWKPAVNPF